MVCINRAENRILSQLALMDYLALGMNEVKMRWARELRRERERDPVFVPVCPTPAVKRDGHRMSLCPKNSIKDYGTWQRTMAEKRQATEGIETRDQAIAGVRYHGRCHSRVCVLSGGGAFVVCSLFHLS